MLSLTDFRSTYLWMPAVFFVALCFCRAMADTQYSPSQMAAAHDLLLKNSKVSQTKNLRYCGDLPRDPALIKVLKYNNEEALVAMPGLTHGLTAIPTGLLRFAFCIPTPPNKADSAATASWLNGFSRKAYNAEIGILLPSQCDAGDLHPPEDKAVPCIHFQVDKGCSNRKRPLTKTIAHKE